MKHPKRWITEIPPQRPMFQTAIFLLIDMKNEEIPLHTDEISSNQIKCLL